MTKCHLECTFEFSSAVNPWKITLPKNYMPEHPFDNGELKIRDEMLAPFPRTPDEMRRHLADYYATITCFDHHLGRVFAALRKKGIEQNTIILFTSDQGLAVGGRHGLMECGVENGDIGRVRQELNRLMDSGEVGGIVQGSKLYRLLYRPQNAVVYHD